MRLSGATPEERTQTFATLVSAFRADPVERWLWPDEEHYDEHFPNFLAAFGGEAFAHDTVWRSEDFTAVAMWLPPGAAPDGDEIVRVLMTTVDESRHPDTLVAVEQMAAAHPRYPHWYLPWFGVDATVQGRGLGSTLMARCLESVDAAGLPAYLETPNPRTVPFYGRHGFQVIGSTQTENCPPIMFMLRQPRTSGQA
jgi:GNAT superfamily N-acetyltransferase